MKIVLAFFVVVLFSVLPAAAAKRIALVIGNSNYDHVVDLRNPTNDADLMESTLRNVGFEVIRLNDLDQRKMKQAMLDFGRKLKDGAEASMFYYAGHGIEVSGQNYLVPIDADTQSTDEADIQNVSVNSFLSLMENSGVPLNIVILDACRDNPFSAFRSSGGGGLAPVKAPRGTYLAYATAPGTVAADGDGQHSPFTLALADSMTQPGLTLEAVLKRTRSQVQTATNGAQLPFDSSAITGEFYFIPAVTIATPTAPEPQKVFQLDTAQEAYQAAGDDPDLLKVVVDKFGDTVWAALAREKLRKLGKPVDVTVAPVLPKVEPVIKDEPVVDAEESTDTPPDAVVAPVTPKVVAKPKAVVVVPKKKAYVKVTPVVRKAAPPVYKPPKQKRRPVDVVVRKPKPRHEFVPTKPRRAANLVSCNTSSFLMRGTACVNGSGDVCRVTFVSLSGKGGPKRQIGGCH